MEVFLMSIVTVSFAYVAKKLENVEFKVDKLQEEVLFLHHAAKNRRAEYGEDVI